MTGIGFTGFILCVIYNKDKDVELFYKTNDPFKYYLFIVSYAVVSLAFFINIQSVCRELFRR